MPPNIKFPTNLPHDDLDSDDLSASQILSCRPAHSAPLATAEDIAPNIAQEERTQEVTSAENSGYFYHDIEVDSDAAPNMGDAKEVRSRPKIRTMLRKFSNAVQNPSEFMADKKRLQQTLSEAGRYAYCLQGIAVWVFDEDSARLVSPSGGFWYNPDQIPQTNALARLVDKSRMDHIPMNPVSPGIDIAGLLWMESNFRGNVTSFVKRTTSIPAMGTPKQSMNSLHGSIDKLNFEKVLIWRDLTSLVQDPDTAKGPRAFGLEEAGFGQAAGVPYNSEISSGLIIFFAKADADPEVLNGIANVTFLRQSAQFIGAAASMTETRHAILGQLYEKKRDAESRSESERNDHCRNTESGDDVHGNEIAHLETQSTVKCFQCCHRVGVWLKKTKGGEMQIPPPLSFKQSLWTAFGAFIGLLVLSSLNEYYIYLSEGEFFLLIGPFGAMMTLCYALSAAPASQPRNAILGQAVAGAVSLIFTYIPIDILPVWLRRAIGPAVAIAAMAKLGIVHPPAGAHAVLYASGMYNFKFYGLVVLSTIISVVPATLINNLSKKRQYPTYWGFPLCLTSFRHGANQEVREEPKRKTRKHT